LPKSLGGKMTDPCKCERDFQSIQNLKNESLVLYGLTKKLFAVCRAFKPATGSMLLLIYAYYEEYQKPMPGNETVLAQALDVKGRTVRDALKTLKDEGIIEISRSSCKRVIKPNFEWVLNKHLETLMQNTFKIINGELKPENSTNYDPLAIEVVNYWNSKNLNPVAIPLCHGDGVYDYSESFAKLIKKICVLIAGRLYNNYKNYRFYHDKPWSMAEIKTSIDNFAFAAHDPDYMPYDKSKFLKLRLSSFLYDTYMYGGKSLAITYQESPKLAMVKTEEPVSLPLYLMLKQIYEQTFLQGSEASPKHDLMLKAGSNRLREWIDGRRKYFLVMPQAGQFADYVVDAALQKLQQGKKTYDPAFTINQKWFWEFFTQYMQKKGILSISPVK
jgi:hypothetical protein